MRAVTITTQPTTLQTQVEAAVSKFGEAPARLSMSLKEAELLSVALANLAARQGGSFDLVVGLANGALLPTKVIAEALGVPFEILRIRRKGSGYKQKILFLKKLFRIPSWLILWGPFKWIWDIFQSLTDALEEGENSSGSSVNSKRVLLVDDCIISGASLQYALGKLSAAGASTVMTAAICWCKDLDVPGGKPGPEPDFYLHRQIHTYPWAGNSDEWPNFKLWLTHNGLSLWN